MLTGTGRQLKQECVERRKSFHESFLLLLSLSLSPLLFRAGRGGGRAFIAAGSYPNKLKVGGRKEGEGRKGRKNEWNNTIERKRKRAKHQNIVVNAHGRAPKTTCMRARVKERKKKIQFAMMKDPLIAPHPPPFFFLSL